MKQHRRKEEEILIVAVNKLNIVKDEVFIMLELIEDCKVFYFKRDAGTHKNCRILTVLMKNKSN